MRQPCWLEDLFSAPSTRPHPLVQSSIFSTYLHLCITDLLHLRITAQLSSIVHTTAVTVATIATCPRSISAMSCTLCTV